MGGKKTESCGRCAMSTVVDAVESDDGENADRDPFGDEAIEIDEEALRRVSPAAWAGRVAVRIDAAVSRFVHRR